MYIRVHIPYINSRARDLAIRRPGFRKHGVLGTWGSQVTSKDRDHLHYCYYYYYYYYSYHYYHKL